MAARGLSSFPFVYWRCSSHLCFTILQLYFAICWGFDPVSIVQQQSDPEKDRIQQNFLFKCRYRYRSMENQDCLSGLVGRLAARTQSPSYSINSEQRGLKQTHDYCIVTIVTEGTVPGFPGRQSARGSELGLQSR
jgi:hypothetical protein